MDYLRLGLGNASSLVQVIHITNGGTRVRVACVYDPLGERQDYELVFLGCSRLSLETIPGAATDEEQAELIGISLGEQGGRRPAVLTTDLFEMHVTYQQFECLKGPPSEAASLRPRASAAPAAGGSDTPPPRASR